HGTEQVRVELGNAGNLVVEDRRAAGNGTVSLANPKTNGRGCTAGLTRRTRPLTLRDVNGCSRPGGREIPRGRGRPPLKAQAGDRRDDDKEAGDPGLANPDPAR